MTSKQVQMGYGQKLAFVTMQCSCKEAIFLQNTYKEITQDPVSCSEHLDPRLPTHGKTTASSGGVISISHTGHILKQAGLMACSDCAPNNLLEPLLLTWFNFNPTMDK